jgi:purine-binding chemotaxis protein CheW
MSDPRFQQSAGDADGKERLRANMAETLQQALRSLGGGGGKAGGAVPGPEALLELAKRAGISPDAQGDFMRAMAIAGAGAGVDASGRPLSIVFGLGDAECALPADAVQGVERVADVTPVPNTVSWILGVIHLRGAILSVVDLRGFFGLPTQPVTSRSRLLVITQGEMMLGLVVDGVNEMRSLAELPEQSSVLAPTWATPFAERVVVADGRPIVVLDCERLLFADKMHRYRAE